MKFSASPPARSTRLAVPVAGVVLTVAATVVGTAASGSADAIGGPDRLAATRATAPSTPRQTVSPPRTSAPAPARTSTPTRAAPGGGRFTLAATETFDRLDRRRWAAYAGTPGCCPDTRWHRSRVTTRDGALRVWSAPDANGRVLSGGVAARGGPWVRTYGRFEARVRMTAGVGNSGAALLWPTRGWPPEIDFFEIGERDAQRRELMLTTHYGRDNQMSQTFVRGRFTRWHTVAVDWTPTRLDYWLDGRRVKTERKAERIPDQPMFPAFQVHVHRNATGRMPAVGSSLLVSSVRVWSWRR